MPETTVEEKDITVVSFPPYNEMIETQLYVIDQMMSFNERNGDDSFYDAFKVELIKATHMAFSQLWQIQALIAEELKSQRDEN